MCVARFCGSLVWECLGALYLTTFVIYVRSPPSAASRGGHWGVEQNRCGLEVICFRHPQMMAKMKTPNPRSFWILVHPNLLSCRRLTLFKKSKLAAKNKLVVLIVPNDPLTHSHFPSMPLPSSNHRTSFSKALRNTQIIGRTRGRISNRKVREPE